MERKSSARSTCNAPPKRLKKTVFIAEILDVHPRTIRRWISEGKIPGYMVGTDLRVDLDDIETMVKRVPSATWPATSNAARATVKS